jgi:hypothetical protein
MKLLNTYDNVLVDYIETLLLIHHRTIFINRYAAPTIKLLVLMAIDCEVAAGNLCNNPFVQFHYTKHNCKLLRTSINMRFTVYN